MHQLCFLSPSFSASHSPLSLCGCCIYFKSNSLIKLLIMKRVNLYGFRQAECIQPTPAAAVVMWIYILIISVDFREGSLHFSTLEECVFTVLSSDYIISSLYFFFAPWEIALLFVSHNYAQRSMGVWACALF